MNYTVFAYLLYLPISVAMTVWVARTLHRNGRVFLVQAFRGNESMADSVNHLLVVGFYLINIGFIAMALRYGDKPNDAQTMIEFLSTKLGVVLLVLGAMHFFNLFNFDKMRRKGLRPIEAAPAAHATHGNPPALPGTGYVPVGRPPVTGV
jgi:hypothetical protein